MCLYVWGCCECPSLSCGTLANAFAGPAPLPTESGSAAWPVLCCLCLGLAGCVSCLAPQCGPLPGIWAAWAQPFPPSSLAGGWVGGRAAWCGGCLAGSPLAEAQVQAVLTAPPPPPSWADRKIPDIVVQRWLQAGRQQGWGLH